MSANFGDWGSPATAAQATINSAKLQKIAEWQDAKAALEAAKANELALRNEIVELYSDVKDPNHAGTENMQTQTGKLKIVHKLNYTLGNGDMVEKALDKIEASQEGGNVIAERLVSWKPELSLTNYKLLTSAQRAIIDTVLTIKPATKTVEFVPTVGA